MSDMDADTFRQEQGFPTPSPKQPASKKLLVYRADAGMSLMGEIMARMYCNARPIHSFEPVKYLDPSEFKELSPQKPSCNLLCTLQLGDNLDFLGVDTDIIEMLKKGETYCAGGFQVAKDSLTAGIPLIVCSNASKTILDKLEQYKPVRIFTGGGIRVEDIAEAVVKAMGLEYRH